MWVYSTFLKKKLNHNSYYGGAGQNIVSKCINYLLLCTIINQEYFLEQLY